MAICLLYNKKLSYIAHSNLLDDDSSINLKIAARTKWEAATLARVGVTQVSIEVHVGKLEEQPESERSQDGAAYGPGARDRATVIR